LRWVRSESAGSNTTHGSPIWRSRLAWITPKSARVKSMRCALPGPHLVLVSPRPEMFGGRRTAADVFACAHKHASFSEQLASRRWREPFPSALRRGERSNVVDHHLARAISAYAYSGFEDSAVVVMDGRGAWEATSIWHGRVLLANFRRFTNISEETSSRHLQALPQ
jgi:hypothetical protein